ncbi:hypothetical protein TNCV_3530751 [Trichonephila clavipes]|uniref:Uncharacterized protein n=1 Tax=Trichonephila clavipes TaxID=2585209 RepID=A0A8X6SXB5_TRICX|nr:hypothetical protein TNCV_3530751 [Trichonephila clavipes]
MHRSAASVEKAFPVAQRVTNPEAPSAVVLDAAVPDATEGKSKRTSLPEAAPPNSVLFSDLLSARRAFRHGRGLDAGHCADSSDGPIYSPPVRISCLRITPDDTKPLLSASQSRDLC